MKTATEFYCDWMHLDLCDLTKEDKYFIKCMEGYFELRKEDICKKHCEGCKHEREVKGGFCPYCKTYNAYSFGDHTECNKCENVWASGYLNQLKR